MLGLPLTALADSFSDGVSAYKAKNYPRAATLLQKALREDSRNPEAMFYLGMAQVHTSNYDAARKAFETVIQMVPTNHELAVKARNNITWLTKQQITLASNSGKAAQVLKTSMSRSSKDNYLTHVIPGGKVVHFSTAKMPLKVYIADGLGVQGWNTGMKQVVTHAMRTWQSASRGKISFTQTYTESNADIIVKWQRNFSDNILGVSPFQMVNDTIIRSDINLAVFYPDSNQPIPMEDLKGIAVHEMGHAIGIRGHSPYPEDIMYYSKTRRQATLSERDMNTVGMLYKLDADIQNNTGMNTAMTKKYYDLYEQGLKAQTSNQPASAINFYRQAMQISRNMPEAKFNLGALLINEGNKMIRQNNLNGARRNFAEAAQLYDEIMRQTTSPPPATRENLEIAKTNLSLVDGALNSR
jgi:tetratricopeptide (TPR) repeat protein